MPAAIGQRSRIAVTAWLLALALQAPAYSQMALAYPSGHVRDRIERAFLVLAYVVSLLWQLAPALFADFRCAGCSPHVPSLLFTGQVIDLTWVGRVFSILFIVLGVAFIALVVRRLRQAPAGATPDAAAACGGSVLHRRPVHRASRRNADRLEPGVRDARLDRQPEHAGRARGDLRRDRDDPPSARPGRRSGRRALGGAPRTRSEPRSRAQSAIQRSSSRCGCRTAISS